MFDKNKCKKCVYMTYFNSQIGCGYFIHGPGGTCLKPKGDEIVDIRGNDPKKCKLYKAKGRNYKIEKVNITLKK